MHSEMWLDPIGNQQVVQRKPALNKPMPTKVIDFGSERRAVAVESTRRPCLPAFVMMTRNRNVDQSTTST